MDATAQNEKTSGTETSEIEMKIRGLMLDPVTNMPIVVLKDVAGEAVLPIWVGMYEANAIALEIEKATPPRPMTHDLLANAIRGLKGEVRRVVISELKDDTFYAVVWMEQEGEAVAMDARPSDALALALRADCPIYVSRQVVECSKQVAAGAQNISPEDLRKWLEGLSDEDTGHYKM